VSDPTPMGGAGLGEEPLLDSLLRDAVPEIKMALGELIDRDNARSLPDRYARLLPETTLAVVLRPDAAEAIRPVAVELEREMTDSCMRHGSLYDRNYRVKLRQADNAGAPLFRVAVLTPEQAKAEAAAAAPSLAASPSATSADESNATVVAGPPRGMPAPGEDATRMDRPAARPGPPPGQFALVMEDLNGKEQTRFALMDAETTVGRRSEDPTLRSTIMLPEVPHVSRRQVALVWDPQGDGPPFRMFNLGLNPVHVGDEEVPGANAGRGPLDLASVAAEHVTRVGADVPMRIGEHGPVLRIVQAEPGGPSVDPDATRFG
jgi:hypothetical protein